jgi:glutamyl/glutaminyl-tRNA synthetase
VTISLPAGFTTRFAPAPTGHLHLGHVVNAVWVWGLARAHGGRVLLRLEDHDRGRCRPEYEASILDDLDWLGLQPDGATTSDFRRGAHPQRQSDSSARYLAPLGALERRGLAYPCTCSRADIARDTGVQAAQDDSVEGFELRYPGTCRARRLPPDATPARRIHMEGDEPERFHDLRLGAQHQDPRAQCGDLLARDRQGNFTYQFAVVVDDLDHGVDVIIRGEDLLASTGRQLRLARLLGRTEPPRVLHHPLIRHPDGRKLSKSAGDSGIRELRASGVAAREVLARAATLGGLDPALLDALMQ